MGRVEKLLDKMRANPRTNFTIADFETVAKKHGRRLRKPGSSHVTFEFKREILAVPARRPIKAPYIRRFVDLIDEHSNE